MNGFRYFMAGVYSTPCDFASVTTFGGLLEPRFSDLPFDKDAVLGRLRDVLDIAGLDEWVFPKGGVAFVWRLEGEGE